MRCRALNELGGRRITSLLQSPKQSIKQQGSSAAPAEAAVAAEEPVAAAEAEVPATAAAAAAEAPASAATASAPGAISTTGKGVTITPPEVDHKPIFSWNVGPIGVPIPEFDHKLPALLPTMGKGAIDPNPKPLLEFTLPHVNFRGSHKGGFAAKVEEGGGLIYRGFFQKLETPFVVDAPAYGYSTIVSGDDGWFGSQCDDSAAGGVGG